MQDGQISEEAKEQVNALLKQQFRPEFLNRLDEIVFYKPLTRERNRPHCGLACWWTYSAVWRISSSRVKLTPAAKELIIGQGL